MKYYGQFLPKVDEFIHNRYFSNNLSAKRSPFSSKKRDPGFFIECGAFDGITESSCFFFEETLGWKGINIEPSPPIFSQLEQNRTKSLNLNVALSDKSGLYEFSHAIHPTLGKNFGNGSLNHTELHLNELLEIGCDFESFRVVTTTYQEITVEQEIERVDLMVLDVEGGEMEVIAGMNGCSKEVLPRILCVEHTLVGLENLKRVLLTMGYNYDCSSNSNSFFVLQNS